MSFFKKAFDSAERERVKKENRENKIIARANALRKLENELSAIKDERESDMYSHLS